METREAITILPHPTFLVTCAAGREADARRELRKALGEVELRTLFLKGNLLLETPGREAADVLTALNEIETQTVGRIVPLRVKAAIGRSPDWVQTLCEAALAAVSFQPGETFRVECKRRGQHEFHSQDVQRSIGRHLEANTPATFRFEEPDYLIAVEIFQDLAWIGCVAREAAIHKTITKMRIHAPGERPLNRAERKLREALETFGMIVGPGTRALDLGAAPGGWTKVLAQEGCEVLAIDSAELDLEVAQMPGVTHFRGRAEEAPSLPDIGRLHLITNDMNLDPAESAQLVVPLVPLLKPTGAVIMTVKFVTPKREDHVREALGVLGPLFEEHRVKRLPHNALETTLFLSRPKGATWS